MRIRELLLQGLNSDPKYIDLSCRYDEQGSKYDEECTNVEDYYYYKAEEEIVRTFAAVSTSRSMLLFIVTKCINISSFRRKMISFQKYIGTLITVLIFYSGENHYLSNIFYFRLTNKSGEPYLIKTSAKVCLCRERFTFM